MSPHARDWQARLVNALLTLYPRDFRDHHEGMLRQTCADVLRDRGAGPGTWLWLLHDAATTSMKVRADVRRERRGREHTTGGGAMKGWGRELGFAVRSLTRAPVFAVVVILTMGLGIGANTAVFSVVYGMLLEPLPYDKPDELVWIQNRYLPRGTLGAVSIPEFWELRQRQPAIEAMSIFGSHEANLTGLDVPVRLEGVVVSPGYFDLLGRQPMLGRAFLPEEGERGRSDVVILSHSLWTTAFASDPGVLDRQIQLDGEGVTVVGVMGPEFRSLAPFVFPGRDPDFWTPYPVDLSAFSLSTVERHNVWVVGRLAAGADRAGAEAGLLEAMHRIEEAYPDISSAGSRDVVAIPIRERIAGDAKGFLKLLSIAVGMLLLLTSVNVMNMLVVRGEARRGEAAVRAALGADRGRLLAYGLSESLVIGVAGGLVGLVLAAAALTALPVLTQELALPGGARVGGPVVAVSFAVALLAGLVTGLLPAVRLAGGDVSDFLKASTGRGLSGGRQRLKSVLVVGQIAGTVVLVSGAGLVLRTLSGLEEVDPGFTTASLSIAEINAMRSDYPTLESVRALYDGLETRMTAVPGVESVTASWQTPLQSGMSDWPVQPETAEDTDWRGADPNWITPSYFDTYGIEVVDGRVFDGADLARDVGAVVISESAAESMWPGERAVGKRVNVDFPDPVWREVIGVVRDIRGRGLRESPRLQTYLTMAPGPFGPNPNLTLTVKSSLTAVEVRRALVEALGAIDPNVPVGSVTSMEAQIDRTLVVERLLSMTLGFFGVLSLLLGVIGVYGLVSYSVHMRQREIGLRIAMGAERMGVLGLVLGQGARLAAIGVLLGLAGAFYSGHLLDSFLFGVTSRDAATLATVCIMVMGVTLLSAYLPARRAATIDPLVALRSE
ncbi:MAG: ABC transporter permease [Gemmatimonadota bacterium]